MNGALKLLVVAVLALMLVPYTYANELLPPDIIRMLEAPALQPDSLGTKDSSKIVSAHNPSDIKKSGGQQTRTVVQYQTLNGWLPLDLIRTWVFPFDP